MVEASKAGMMRAEMGTILGYMHLNGRISEIQMSAGLRYAELAYRYRKVKGLPSRNPKPALNEIKGASLNEIDPEKISEIIERYEKIYYSLTSSQRKIIDGICLEDLYPDWDGMMELRAALDILAFELGLTKSRK